MSDESEIKVLHKNFYSCPSYEEVLPFIKKELRIKSKSYRYVDSSLLIGFKEDPIIIEIEKNNIYPSKICNKHSEYKLIFVSAFPPDENMIYNSVDNFYLTPLVIFIDIAKLIKEIPPNIPTLNIVGDPICLTCILDFMKENNL